MTSVHVLFLFLKCHHQAGFILTSWPQEVCYNSRHHITAMQPKVRTEVINVCYLSSPWTPLSHNPPPVHLDFKTHWPGLYVCRDKYNMAIQRFLRNRRVNKDS